MCDRYVSKYADLTLNHTRHIQQERREYWHDFRPKKETLYAPHLRPAICHSSIISVDQKERNKLLFIGNILDHSQWSNMLNVLERTNYKLKVVGRVHPRVANNLRQIFLSNDSHIEYLGYLDRSDLKDVIGDCLVGLNVIFGKNVHTSYAIPSKVVDYLRFRMPVIVTKDMGSFTDVVIRYKLGRVIDREEELVDAIDSIKCSYNDYGTNIDEYFAQFPFDNFTDYLIENCAPLGNR